MTMSVDADVRQREASEKRAPRIVGICFLLLAVYIAYESGVDLKTVGKGTQNRCAIVRSQPSIWGGTLEELLHSQEDLEMLEMNST